MARAKKLFAAFGALAAILIGSQERVEAAPILYAITFDDELITLDTTTGAGALVGLLDSSMAAFGLGERSGGLYTFDQNADRIRQLDPTNADTLATIDVGIAAVGEGGLDFRADGTGFLSVSSGSVGQLWSFDIVAGTSSAITAAGGLIPSMDGLAFSPAGILYGISQAGHDLYTINQTTGATTLVGATGFSGASLSGLAFRSDGGLFWANETGSLFAVNTTTGAATKIGDTGFDRISGLAFLDTQPVPEPGTLLLLGSGIASLALRRRRHSR